MGQVAEFKPAQVSLIKQQFARDCTDNEFDAFLTQAKAVGLNPFTKQISVIVFNKNNDKYRNAVTVVTIGGLRAIAARCKDYRPASEPAVFIIDPDLKGPTNPKAIESVIVTLHKQDNSGAWYPVIGTAEWDEFAPTKDEWAWDEAAKKKQPTGNKTLSDSWATKPKLMIQKCAEAQALRFGWPEEYAGLYVEEEMDAAVMRDVTPSEEVAQFEEAQRLAMVGGPSILFIRGDVVNSIPLGEIHDKLAEYIATGINDSDEMEHFLHSNKDPLQQFWAHDKNAALALKKEIEKRSAKLKSAEQGPKG